MPNNATLLLLDKHTVESLLRPDDVLKAVHEAFVLHSDNAGRVFPVVRESIPTHGVFGIKSGDVPSQQLLGFKAAGFWPANRHTGHEPHQATIMLIDPATGRPLCVIDGNEVTTARTGAAGALGLQYLARSDSQRLCVFGSGVQARIQVRFALMQYPAITRVDYATHNGDPSLDFEIYVASLGVAATLATDRNAAVSAADIVITATPGGGALFDAHAVKPGTHINCVGADTKGKRELPAGLLDRVQRFVDDRTQARQLGETQWAPDSAVTEIGDLLCERVSFARQPEDITVFDMTGLALQDLTVARLLYERATISGIGLQIPWPW